MTRRRSAAAGFHGGDPFDTNRTNRRRDAEKHAGHRGHGDCKDEHAPVGRQCQVGRAASGGDCVQQHLSKQSGDDDSGDRAGGRKHETFRGKLTDQRHARCADRDPHGNLAIARARTRQKQVRQIRARNQENQGGDGKQELERIFIPRPQRADARRRRYAARRNDLKRAMLCAP